MVQISLTMPWRKARKLIKEEVRYKNYGDSDQVGFFLYRHAQYSPRKCAGVCGDQTRAAQSHLVTVKLKTLRTSVMGRQKSKNTDK